MTSIMRKTYSDDCSLVATALTNNDIDKNTLEATKRLSSVVHAPLAPLTHRGIKMLCKMVDFRITAKAINSGIYFRALKPLAVISGAGIAGLAASFELRARGFNVVVAEMRKEFSRFNIINLSNETQAFLKKFHLLEKFEKSVAARIKEHRYVLIEKNKSATALCVSPVSDLQHDESVSFEPENFKKLFDRDGIYSVSIKDLQNFLAENALAAGVKIYGDVTVDILSRTDMGGVSKIQITADCTLQPDLFFIAEGAHSKTALKMGMETKQVTNACTGESWIFGNLTYFGKETFVVSIIDASEKTLRIANVIFNAKSHVINVAVTSNNEISENEIRELVLQTVGQVFDQKAYPIEKMPIELLTTVNKPVHVSNRVATQFSIDNVFCIGDTAVSSSPLAALGGTLGLTLVPRTIRQSLDDRERNPIQTHKNFNKFSEAYTSRWIEKSNYIKTEICIKLFEKARSLAEERQNEN